MTDPDNLPVPASLPCEDDPDPDSEAKIAVCETLAAAGITQVVVEFDGYADNGQIQTLTAYQGDPQISLPDTKVLRQIPCGSPEQDEQANLYDAIENLCYDYLEETHPGWPNDDGAYGEFRINVQKRTVELDYNGRFTDTWHESHTF
jgi:hypothetical protein